MQRSRFTGEQVTYVLKLAELGTPVKDVCRQHVQRFVRPHIARFLYMTESYL